MRVRIKRFMQYQKSEAFRSGPGERGEAVVLLGEEKTKAAALIPKEAFNRIASDKISLERSIPDVRDPEWVLTVIVINVLSFDTNDSNKCV